MAVARYAPLYGLIFISLLLCSILGIVVLAPSAGSVLLSLYQQTAARNKRKHHHQGQV